MSIFSNIGRTAAFPGRTHVLGKKCFKENWAAPSVCMHYFPFLLFVLLICSVSKAYSQRNFSVTISRTDQNNIQLTWTAQSATPIGDVFIIPQFEAQRSSDLTHWIPISGILSGSLHQILSVADSNSTSSFYRVQSIIQKEYAELNGAKLASGQLTGADFFGARLFRADLSDATLNGATLSAADVRFADFSNADLGGADLFNVEASSAIFDSANLAGVDASFGNFENASLFDVDLTGSDFSFATLTGADLDFAILKQVTMDANTMIDDKAKRIWQLVNTNAAGGTFTNQNFSFANLLNQSFNGTKFNGSDFSASAFRGSDLRGANFTLANMRFADFRNSQMDSNTVIDST